MRDQDYARLPAPGTHRIALLGASTVMGWGVADAETFEALVEGRLNRERAGRPHVRYEILNFGVPGYQPPQQLAVLDRVLSFRPGVVLYMSTGSEPGGAIESLAKAVHARIPVPYDYLAEAARRAQIEPSTGETTALRRLEPFRWEILTWLYREIVQRCRAEGVVPAWVFVPQVPREADRRPWQQEIDNVRRIAEEAGFAIIDLRDVYDGHALHAVRIAEWDNHPNAQGHRHIADRLYRVLLENDILLSPTRARVAR
jgi:hypothetical protein